jgi:hypothetical protein
MEMVEPEFKILHISEAIGLPFEGLYFVYQALYGTACNAMLEIGQQASSIRSQSFGDIGQLLYA